MILHCIFRDRQYPIQETKKLVPVILSTLVSMLLESKPSMDFYHLPMRALEATEKVECIRYLEYGKKIKMVETSYMGIEIDTPEDLEKAAKFIKD